MLLEIVLILIFVLINGFFAASEIAVVTVRKSRIKQLLEEGKTNAKSLYELRHNPDKFLATIQFGVTCAGAVASAIGGATAIDKIKPLLQEVPISIISKSSEAIAISIVVIFVTYFSIIFGELVPKSIALANPESIALFVSPIVHSFSKVAGFFVKIFSLSTNFILKPFGKKAFTERAFISEEEVKLLVEEGGEQGIFEPDERELIHSVFEFTDTFVKEVMIPAPQMVTVKIDMPLEEMKQIIIEEKFSRYPVIGQEVNDIKGILYAKDFYNSLLKTGTVNLRKIIKPPLFIPETMKISNLMREMQRRRFHMAIVVDEYGAVSGLVTMEDLLEEIVGEIRDEYDTESPVIQLNDGSLIIDAATSISDLREDYNIPLEESSEYESIAGFILTYLQRIPVKGDIIEVNGLRLKIIEMAGQRIVKIKLEKVNEDKEG
ncbi:MAG: hemolysin family protein [Proteobacteria bacterium]|nr:hemolysin family protein [Pseudomonadota bacterium]